MVLIETHVCAPVLVTVRDGLGAGQLVNALVDSGAALRADGTRENDVARVSAGLLLYRVVSDVLEVLLAHPGGPIWAKKDAGAWTIPKGEVEEGEELLTAARREFREETGVEAVGPFVPLSSIRLKSGKLVHAWAVRQEIDVDAVTSNTFTMQWPPRSGKMATFPEIDRAAYFDLTTAREKLNPAQTAWLDELIQLLGTQGDRTGLK